MAREPVVYRSCVRPRTRDSSFAGLSARSSKMSAESNPKVRITAPTRAGRVSVSSISSSYSSPLMIRIRSAPFRILIMRFLESACRCWPTHSSHDCWAEARSVVVTPAGGGTSVSPMKAAIPASAAQAARSTGGRSGSGSGAAGSSDLTGSEGPVEVSGVGIMPDADASDLGALSKS